MKSIRKKFILAFIASFVCACANAVPGMFQYIPDSSGEYVYYSDKSFSRTSFLGFLYYNDSTYSLRYYAPADNEKKLPAKDITLYFSVNPNSTFLDLTGENIIGATSEEDTDIVNYMHDMFYEFTARAQKAFLDGSETVESKQDFEQFGGKVVIVFNTQVPIFNIESIKSAAGDKILSVITTGQLTDSSDTSFTDYKGIENAPKDKSRGFKKLSSAKNTSASFESQSIKLTSQWTQTMENLWLLGDYALISMNTISVPDSYSGNIKNFEDTLIRKLSESTTGSYTIWKMKGVSRKGSVIAITNTFYQPDSGDVTKDFKIITKRSNGTYAYITMTVFDDVYKKNKPYFEGILKSYTVK